MKRPYLVRNVEVTASKLSIFYGKLVSGFFQLGNVCFKFLNVVPRYLHHVAFAFASYTSITGSVG